MDAEFESGSDAIATENRNLFIAPDHLPGDLADSLQPGEKLSLTLVGRDADGDMEFRCEHGNDEGPKDFREDLRQNVEGY